MNLQCTVLVGRPPGDVSAASGATFCHYFDLEKFVVTMITTVSGRISINTNLKPLRWNWSVSFVDCGIR